MDASQRPPLPVLRFTHDPSVEEWNVPPPAWLRAHDKHWDGLATAALVFDRAGRVLLVQRAAHDSMPGRWEVPGGAADAEDPSVLFGAARELFEEAGLVATAVRRPVPQGPTFGGERGHVFTNRTGRRFFCRFAFEVDVESADEVRLDPNEHQDFVWATEDEVRDEKTAESELPITTAATRDMILEGFRLRREDNERAVAAGES